MKMNKYILSLAVLPLFCGAQPFELNLAGAWRLACTTNETITCGITVPGDVHSALYAAGRIPDPYFGRNEESLQWIATSDWCVSRTFTVDAAFLAKKRIVLELEDVDTFADILVNGVKVGATSDRFARWTFDVKGALKVGANEIRAVFRSAWLEGDRRAERGGRKFPMSNVLWCKNQAMVRKPACHAGWDWGLSQMVTGFCGPVKLIAHDGLKIDYIRTEQELNDDFTRCDLTVLTDVTDADGRASTVTNRLTIANPKLWWPNGAGEPNLTTFSFKVGDETVTRTIGIRKLEIVNTPDVDANGKRGARLVVKVNGRELFIKGANWIPCDAFDARQTPAKYRDLLQSAKDANMNMIRLWGGGQFEKEAFYDICDELGILIWHDQMFSCAVYPADPTFLDEVRRELTHQLRRLHDHASIALWCGDNECVGALKWFAESKADPDFYKGELVKRHAVQEECVKAYDPSRMFWPSSPCAGPGNFADNWKNDSEGDMHNWDVWHENQPFATYYAYNPRFCSEFGYQSFPSMEVAETFASRQDILAHGADFEWHQKNAGGNRRIRETMARYFNPPVDVAAELLLSQFQQAMAIKMGVNGWRAQRPRCMGTLFWQLNDNWPVSSWSSIEYGGKWKPLQYLAKRFFAPVSVVVRPDVKDRQADSTRGTIYGVNDTTEDIKGDLTVAYLKYDGTVVSSETRAVVLTADSSTAFGAFAEPAPETFLSLVLTTPKGTVANDWHFKFFREVPLAQATIATKVVAATDETLTVELTADRPAFFVWANVRNVRGEFDDNCLTLLPGQPRTLTFTAKEKTTAATLKARLSVTSLAGITDLAGATPKAAGPKADYAADPANVTAYRESAVAIADKKLKEVDAALARENPIKGLGRRLSSGGDFGGFFMWDSTFQAVWASRVKEGAYPVLSSLDNFYLLQLEDGFIAREYSSRGLHCWSPDHPIALNPPILSWGEIEVYRNGVSDKARLAKVYPKLVRFHEAVRRRYRRADGLYFGDQLGCGMDDIVRSPYGMSAADKRKGGILFDASKFGPGLMLPSLDAFRKYWLENRSDDSSWNRQMGWIDITAQMAFDCLNLASIADEIGKADEAAAWRREHAEIAKAVNDLCWDEERGYYFDRWEGGIIPRYHGGSFWVMVAKIPTPERAKRMVKAFYDPEIFGTPVPFPALAKCDPDYDSENHYWSGQVWPPTAYIAVRGLLALGFDKEAQELGRRYYNATFELWKATGTVWENMSSQQCVRPKKISGDEFCGWAALAPICLPGDLGFADKEVVK